VWGAFHGQLSRQGDDSGLGGAVRDRWKIFERLPGDDRSRIHDDALARLEVRPGRLGQEKDEVELLVQGVFPFALGHILQPVEIGHGRVVVEDIDAAEALDREVDQRAALLRIRQIAGSKRFHHATGGANLLLNFLLALLGEIASDDPRAFAGKQQSGRPTHRARRSGNDAYLLFEFFTHVL